MKKMVFPKPNLIKYTCGNSTFDNMAKKILTTNQGVPVADNRNSLIAGQRGPVLIKDVSTLSKNWR